MVRLATHLGTLLLVTGVADFGLRHFVPYLVLARVNLMAVAAHDIARRMRAGLPSYTVAALMTAQASVIPFIGSGRRLLAKAAIHLWRLAAALVGAVVVTFAVAVRTGRRALVGRGAMFGFADGENRGIQLQHGGRPRRFIRLVVATRALCIALEDQILGVGVGCKVPDRCLGRICCRKRQACRHA